MTTLSITQRLIGPPISLSHYPQQLAAPLANHLWQSTVFALLAATLTLLLKRNSARVRFHVCLVASLKFLIPFAAVERVGHGIFPALTRSSPDGFAFAFERAGQTLDHAATPILALTWREPRPGLITTALTILWALGSAKTLILWWHKWHKVCRMQRAAKSLTSGIEVERMQTLARAVGIRPMPILLVSSRLEPGIFGLFRPVLLWPAGMSAQLSDAQLQSILAHELWHARRRDNLIAAIQMFIETIFWFHPLVWWLGSRQVEERELACDEAVLALGNEPAVYAEAILKACRFCVESPLACVAGVNGSNLNTLNTRIRRIMKSQQVTPLSISRKFTIVALAMATITGPLLLGAASTPAALAHSALSGIPSGPVHVTSLKRSSPGSGTMTLINHPASGTSITNITVRDLIELAYNLKDYQLTGGPTWIDKDHFDLAFTGGAPSGAMQSIASNAALRQILADQFHLVLRQETKSGQVFALVISQGGAKFATVTPPNAPGTTEPMLSERSLLKNGQGQINITGGPGGLADTLSAQVGRPILDNTGLTGIYKIDFHWATASASAATISADLQQQLGLALVPKQGPVQNSVVESVTIPAGS
jgi:bla regulator protein BlaR1